MHLKNWLPGCLFHVADENDVHKLTAVDAIPRDVIKLTPYKEE